MPERRLSAVVLAAGEGTRMRSERPKPLHLLCGRPMVLHVLDAMAELDVRRVVVVVGHRGRVGHQDPGAARAADHGDRVRRAARPDSAPATRWPSGSPGFPTTLTTRSTTSSSCPATPRSCAPQTLAALVRAHRAEDAGATLLTATVENPAGYGRVVHGKDGDVARIVEEADATEEEQAIDEVNTSIYCFRRSLLAPTLRRLARPTPRASTT